MDQKKGLWSKEKSQLIATLACIGDGVIITDIHGQIEFMNTTAENLTGWTSQDAVGKHFDEVFPIVDLNTEELQPSPIVEVLKTGIATGLKNYSTLVAKDGMKYYVSASCSPIRDELHTMMGMVFVCRDITRIKTMEEDLRIEGINLLRMFDVIPVGMILIDSNAVIKQVNQAFLNMLGTNEDGILDQRLGDAIHCKAVLNSSCGNNPCCAFCEINRSVRHVLEAGMILKDVIIKHRVIRNEEEIDPWYKFNFVPITMRNERNIIIVMDDITTIKEKEEQLIKAKDFSDKMLEQFPIMIWRTGKDNQFDYLNREWLEFTGMDLQEGLRYGWKYAVYPEDSKWSKKVVRAAFEQRHPFQIEHRMKRYDGEYRWVMCVGAPYFDLENKYAGFIGTVFDIHDRKIAEVGLRRYQVLSENARDLILFIDSEGNIIEANQAAERAYGYSGEEFLSLNINDIDRARNKDYSYIGKDIGKGVIFDTVHFRKDGSSFPVEISTQGTILEDRNVLLCIIRDITERMQAGKALRESEEKYRKLFENAADYIYLHEAFEQNGKSVIIEVNDAACQRLGYSKEELYQLTPYDICSIEMKRYVGDVLRNLLERGTYVYETVHVDKNGIRIPVEVNALCFKLNGKKVVLSLCRDISERKQSEIIIQESQQKYKSLFLNMTDAFILNRILYNSERMPVDFELIEGNRAFEQMFGFELSKITGKKISEVLPALMKDVSIKIKEALIEEGKIDRLCIEEYYVNHDKRWFSISAYTPVNGMLAFIITEITDRKLAEQKLIDSREKYQKLIMNINSGFGYFKIISDDQNFPVDSVFIELNKEFETILGMEMKGLVGESIYDIYPALADVVTSFLKLIALYGNRNEGFYFPDFYFENTGRWCSIYMYCPEREHFAIVLSDITEQHLSSEILVKSRDAAEAANQAKSEFLANMSHEIRTPINGIVGMIELTLLTRLNEEQNKNLITAKNCADSLLNIINDILDFSKLEAGKLKIEHIDFNIRDMVEEIMKIQSVRASEKELGLNYSFFNVPPFLKGDPGRLQQILNNLINNAIKFTEDGEIAIFIRLIKAEGESVTLEFSVKDTGIGISQEGIGRLFKSFSQVDGSYTKKYKGTGLGLVICKQLVEMMNGEIWLNSEVGKGSSFYFTIPLQIGREAIPLRKQMNKMTKNDYRILLAEDDKVNQKVLSKMLSGQGYTVTIVNNGMEAVEAYQMNSYDIVLMDIQMPVMDGLEASKKIRELEEEKQHTPIVALTAYALQGDRERFISMGMDEYISKPVSIEELLRVIDEVARIKQQPISSSSVETVQEQADFMMIPKINENGELVFMNAADIEINETMLPIMKEIDEHMSVLLGTFTDHGFDKTEKVIHKIKELFRQIEAEDLKGLAFKIELAARRGNLNDIIENAKILTDEYSAFKKKYHRKE